MIICKHEKIKEIIETSFWQDLMKEIEDGFVLYSTGKVNVPPVGHLGFINPPGDVHIKYGYITQDDYYVVKIASGFYDNYTKGVNAGNGLMLVFSQTTGTPLAILLDEGYLTDIRTAMAGAIAAKHLAPSKITNIGIIGTGVQARLQPGYLKSVTPCRSLVVWGRNSQRVIDYAEDMMEQGFEVTIAPDIQTLTQQCNLIVTTTASTKPILFGDDILPGTHITAVGADGPGKQELHDSVFKKADLIVADSISQCTDHGDLSYAMKHDDTLEKIKELGAVIMDKSNGRINDTQFTIADLTGVAIQDIQIAKFVYERL